MPERTAWVPTLAEIAVILALALILTSTSIAPMPWWAPGTAWLAVVALTIVVSLARAALQRILFRRTTRPASRQTRPSGA